MSDDERIAELWPHVDGWPDPPPLASATREDIEAYANIRLAAQCLLDAEARTMPTILRGTPEQAWEWGCQQWAKLEEGRTA